MRRHYRYSTGLSAPFFSLPSCKAHGRLDREDGGAGGDAVWAKSESSSEKTLFRRKSFSVKPREAGNIQHKRCSRLHKSAETSRPESEMSPDRLLMSAFQEKAFSLFSCKCATVSQHMTAFLMRLGPTWLINN